MCWVHQSIVSCFFLNLFLILFFYFLLFKAAPIAYASSQARGQIRAIAPGLHHSTQQRQISEPLSKAREQTHILMDMSWICFHWPKQELLFFFLNVFIYLATPWHVKTPGPGIEPSLQLHAGPQLQQVWILNLLCDMGIPALAF